jgi:hypothetical protein
MANSRPTLRGPANEYLVLCGSAHLTSRLPLWCDRRPLRLCLGRGSGRVRLRIRHLTEGTCARAPAVAVDLVEIAAFVYAADQAVSRGRTGRFDYGTRWRRRFRFEIPVRCPGVWRRPDVSAALAETLGFLSDDDYEFGFTRLENPPPLRGYLFDRADEEEGEGVREVLLFSGGLDSLGGAVREVLLGQRKVVLVSHRPANHVYSRQRDLAGAITDLLPGRLLRPLHVAIEANKGKRLDRDSAQRTRSFLFAAMAAAVARIFRLPGIRFYENGVVSLNLPISPQVLGGRASRTTHPQALDGFRRLFTALFDEPFGVENPFRWMTKADVLAEIRGAGYGRLCARTCSCVHTREITTAHPHCSRCSQCLDRRISALAAGLGPEEDPPQGYRSDVLVGPREGTDLTLIERYVGTARRICHMGNPTQFLANFPELARALRYVDLPAAQAAEEIFKLYQRHAQQVCRALAEAVGRYPEGVVLWEHPANCLLSLACGRRPRSARSAGALPAGVTPPNAQTPPRLEVDRERFEARFGGRPCPLGNTNEFWLLAQLHQRPGIFISVDTLRTAVWDNDSTDKNAIQRAASNLRRRLRAAGITEVVIDGSQRGHYRLVLPGDTSHYSA